MRHPSRSSRPLIVSRAGLRKSQETAVLKPGLTLFFIRHGETDWNVAQRYQGQTDVPLNDNGRGQAPRNGRVLAERLGAGASSFAYVSSPLERATETMELVRAGLGLEPAAFAKDARLSEIHFGQWEGQLWGDLPRTDPVGFAARKADTWSWVPGGGESYAMLADRVAPWLASLERDTLAVSHGGVSRVVRGLVLGLEGRAVPGLEVPQDKVLMLRDGAQNWI